TIMPMPARPAAAPAQAQPRPVRPGADARGAGVVAPAGVVMVAAMSSSSWSVGRGSDGVELGDHAAGEVGRAVLAAADRDEAEGDVGARLEVDHRRGLAAGAVGE